MLTKPAFDQSATEQFEAPERLVYHLHPPLLRALGLKRKLSLGPWFRPVLRALAGLRRLRGTPLDLFGLAALRRKERELIAWYEQILEALLAGLDAENHELAVRLARSPDGIRGYEHVKLRSVEVVQRQVADLLVEWNKTAPEPAPRRLP